MANVTIYRTTYCPYCDMAERLFSQLGVDVNKIDVTEDMGMRKKLVELTGQRTVPQIFIDETSIGGYTDAYAMLQRGELKSMLGLG